MSNPYQPPEDVADDAGEAEHARLLQRVVGMSFGREIGATVVLSGCVGLAVGLLILSVDEGVVLTFGTPAVGWVILLGCYLVGIRRRAKPLASNLLLASVLAVPAYILYVPVCTVGAMLASPVLGSVGYGPGNAAVILASVVAFAAIAFLIAVIVRSQSPSIPPNDGRPSE